jgi:aminopeptidase N
LTILAHRFPETAEAKAALENFHDRFTENALVIDKWLAVQAAIPGAATLERIQGLMETPLFKRTNPNRMRALVGTFAFANPTGFGRADGAGYRFLAQEILDIDQRNPQLAARILTSMRSWRLLEPVRADHARSALMQIERAGNLSTDVRDIVDRILKE